MARTAKQRAALRKAQLASARKRRGKGKGKLAKANRRAGRARFARNIAIGVAVGSLAGNALGKRARKSINAHRYNKRVAQGKIPGLSSGPNGI